VVDIRKALVRRHGFRVDALSRQLARQLARWLAKLAAKEARKATGDLRKDKGTEEKELLDLLVKFGLRQVSAAGSRTAADLDGEWLLAPNLVASVIREKEILVQRLMADVREQVRGSIRQIMLDAERERPKPSVGEIARRIRTQFHGSGGGYARGPLADVTEAEFGILPTEIQRTYGKPLYVFSPERAALIARTESAQNESKGIFEGMKASGIEQIEWLSSGSSNHGNRRHDLMNGKIVSVGEYFKTPLGHRMRYPCDPKAPISETANCGCTFAPARIKT
jgi:hypothetical protein